MNHKLIQRVSSAPHSSHRPLDFPRVMFPSSVWPIPYLSPIPTALSGVQSKPVPPASSSKLRSPGSAPPAPQNLGTRTRAPPPRLPWRGPPPPDTPASCVPSRLPSSQWPEKPSDSSRPATHEGLRTPPALRGAGVPAGPTLRAPWTLWQWSGTALVEG